jgi:hypothetical protein
MCSCLENGAFYFPRIRWVLKHVTLLSLASSPAGGSTLPLQYPHADKYANKKKEKRFSLLSAIRMQCSYNNWNN